MPKKERRFVRPDYTVTQKLQALLVVEISTFVLLGILRKLYPTLDTLVGTDIEVMGCYNQYKSNGDLQELQVFVGYGKKKFKPKMVLYKQSQVFKFSPKTFVKHFIEVDVVQAHEYSLPPHFDKIKARVNSVNLNKKSERLEVAIWRVVEY